MYNELFEINIKCQHKDEIYLMAHKRKLYYIYSTTQLKGILYN